MNSPENQVNSPESHESNRTTPALPLSLPELIALMGLLLAMGAMSIDMMLPALPDIGASLGVASPASLPLLVTVFMLGLAGGQLLWGPIADRFGRRHPLLIGIVLYGLATVIAVTTQNFSELLLARFLQGVGGSVGRIIVMAIVRDLFVGRQMARVMSMTMMVFILVPIVAPSVGQLIVMVASWRWIFAAMLVTCLTALAWSWARLPETQRPLAPGTRRLGVGEALVLVLANRVTTGYGVATGFMLGELTSYIASAQQVLGEGYGLGSLFPFAFAAIAVAIAAASFTNARLVSKLGMRRLSHTALAAHLGLSTALALIGAVIPLPLWLGLGGLAACFFLYGLILSNFNAIAMHPMGHAAGMAASLTGSFATGLAALIATFVAGNAQGSITPLFAAFAVLGAIVFLLLVFVEGRGNLFKGE